MGLVQPDPTRPPRPNGSRKIGMARRYWPLIVLPIVGGVLVYALYFTSIIVQVLYETMLVFAMAFLPPLICIVQNATKYRQASRLRELEDFPVAKTIFYRTALSTIKSIEEMSIGSTYSLPMFVYGLTIFIGGLGFMVSFNYPSFFTMPNLLLKGLYDSADPTALVDYQRQTFVVIGVAFFASYAYSLGMLLNRVNTSDLYPISLYYYAVRVVIACGAAAVLRHTFGAWTFTGSGELTTSNAMIIMSSFAIGFAPDLFMLTIIRRGFQVLKIWAVRDDPGADARPDSMPLLMIDDLSRDKVDHLNDIGIDSVQVLARQNPLLLLARLPYDLTLIVDWIAQAQLYVFVRDGGMQILRKIYVRDIFDFRHHLNDDASASRIASALGLPDAGAAEIFRDQIDDEPTYLRLRQVRDSLSEGARPKAARVLPNRADDVGDGGHIPY